MRFASEGHSVHFGLYIAVVLDATCAFIFTSRLHNSTRLIIQFSKAAPYSTAASRQTRPRQILECVSNPFCMPCDTSLSISCFVAEQRQLFKIVPRGKHDVLLIQEQLCL